MYPYLMNKRRTTHVSNNYSRLQHTQRIATPNLIRVFKVIVMLL